MAEEQTDANTGTEDATGEDSSSDAVTIEPIVSDDGLVSTMEYQTVKKEADTSKSDDTSDDAEQNTSEDPSTEKQDFDKHPRFQELIQEKNELKTQLNEMKTQINELSKSKQTGSTESTDQETHQTINFKNIMAMDDDAIVEEVTTNPKGFFSNLANQIAHELKMDLTATERAKQTKAETLSIQQKAEKTRTEFFKDKADGQAMLQDGRIKAYISENPGHNEISAYHALAGESIVQSKIENAVKQAKEQIYKELKAKGKAGSTATSTGNTILSSDKSPELKDSSKFGGRDNVLLNRLLARQAS